MADAERPVAESDAIRARERVRQLAADAEAQVTLFSGLGEGDFLGLRLNPTDAAVAAFRAAALHFGQELTTRTLVAYSPGRKPDDHELAWLPTESVPELSPILRQLSSPLNLEVFRETSPAASSLRLYVVSLRRTNPGWIHFVRSMSIKSRLRRSKKIALLWRGGVYDILEEDPLLFDQRFDAVVAGRVLLVDDQREFEKSLGFLQMAAQAARETVEQMSLGLRIQNRDLFLEAVTSDVNMIAKVRSIHAKMSGNPAYREAMTMERIVQFVSNHPTLGIALEGSLGEEEFVFHADPQRRWQILKFLDDDYLRSPMTELDYEANSKSVLS